LLEKRGEIILIILKSVSHVTPKDFMANRDTIPPILRVFT
jgi:hypothetical protein